ncbi:MAG: universal stress protein [bacterium]
METFSNIMVPVDMSDNCMGALKQAIDMQEGTDASVTVLHVVPKTNESSRAFDAIYKKDVSRKKLFENYVLPEVEEWIEALELDIDWRNRLTVAARVGRPSEEIVEYASENGVDLIVMGTHGRTGIKRYWIGSVAERVVRIAQCTVMVVPTGERANPDVMPEDEE